MRFEPPKVPKRVTSGLLYVGVKYYLKRAILLLKFLLLRGYFPLFGGGDVME